MRYVKNMVVKYQIGLGPNDGATEILGRDIKNEFVTCLIQG
jgi:hypothetical protein